MASHAELHLLGSDTRELEFLLVLGRGVAKVEESEGVKLLGVVVQCGVEVHCVGGEEHSRACRDLCAIFQSQGGLCLALEGDYYASI